MQTKVKTEIEVRAGVESLNQLDKMVTLVRNAVEVANGKGVRDGDVSFETTDKVADFNITLGPDRTYKQEDHEEVALDLFQQLQDISDREYKFFYEIETIEVEEEGDDEE